MIKAGEERYQARNLLQDAIREVLPGGEVGLLERLAGRTQRGSDEKHLLPKLFSVLIDYCSYKIAPIADVDPFDDPFVGAVLLTQKGTILGAHRKVSTHETHAEPTALLDALRPIDNAEARAVLAGLAEAYTKKIWLEGASGVHRLLRLFTRAGDAVRGKYGTGLIFLSTLEPCRDFETQPSCAAILAAFRPDLVAYASDDVNPKGQGRERMEAEGILVLPNANIDANLRANRRFYLAMSALDRIISSVTPQTLGDIRYCLVNQEHIQFIPRFSAGRLTLEISPPQAFRVFLAHSPPQHSASGFQLPAGEIDMARLLFSSRFDAAWLSHYLQLLYSQTAILPGHLIFAGGIDESFDRGAAEHALQALRSFGVRVHLNVKRRQKELVTAVALIDWWGKIEDADQLVLVAKGAAGYARYVGRTGTLLSDADFTSLRRLTIVSDPSASWEVRRFIQSLKQRQLFARGGALSETSLEVAFARELGAEVAEHALGNWLASKGLLARATFLGPRSTNSPTGTKGPQGASADMVELPDPLTLAPYVELDSYDWRCRQTAGAALGSMVSTDPELLDRMLLDRLPTGASPANLQTILWRQACSLLNALRRVRPRPTGTRVIQRLREFRETVERALEASGGVAVTTLLDVVWRYLAASSWVATSGQDIEDLLAGGSLEPAIRRDDFLLAELLLYTCEVGLPPATRTLGFAVLERAVSERRGDVSGVARRIARLLSVAPLHLQREFQATVYPAFSGASKRVYEEQRRLCLHVSESGLGAVVGPNAEPGSLGAWLSLRTGRAAQRTGLVSVLGESLVDSEAVASWRGDKTRLAELVLSEVPADRATSLLREMAMDEDPTVQWAALSLAMAGRIPQNPRSESKEAGEQTRRRLSEAVEAALRNRPHYWLQREVASLFYEYHGRHRSREADLTLSRAFSYLDLPSLRSLLHSAPEDEIHPEVHLALERLRRLTKRVLLVLPPLHTSSGKRQPHGGSPALGLALIGTALLGRGHDVELYDLHRHPEREDELLEACGRADFVAFNTVASTYESTSRLLAEISHQWRERRPTAIVGGQAATLLWREMLADPDFRFWDYIVLGDGDRVVPVLVEAKDALARRQLQGVIPFDSIPQKPLRTSITSDEWSRAPWIDRRVFVSGNRQRYEPSATRSVDSREAHLLTSRGCSWHCTFCTEAIIRGGGELRRSAEDVLGEITYLLHEGEATRVHFVDDNLLPQIAAPKSAWPEGLAWTETLLNGLAELKDLHQHFSFRAIMRLEDIVAYESELAFADDLARAGCTLLAFGIEHGLEDRRTAMKKGGVSNETILRIVHRLRSVGIASKGYFIIGGAQETHESAEATVRFAVESGLTLAYFAIFKDFRGLARLSGRLATADGDRRQAATDLRRGFLRFDTLSPDLGEIMEGLEDHDLLSKLIGPVEPRRLAEAKRAARALSNIGFDFRDIFKYSDFHEIASLAGPLVWSVSGEDGEKALLRATRRAYFEFFLREAFVPDYQWLVDLGY